MTPLDEELATLYVLDQLESSERSAFAARLLREPQLRALLHSVELTLERRIRSLPQHTPPGDLLARVESQLDEPPVGREFARAPSSPSPATVIPFWPAFTRWFLPAAAAIAIGAATFFYLDRQRTPQSVILVVGLDPQRSTVTEIPLRDAAHDTDARFIQLASLAEQFWTKPNQFPDASETTRDRPAYALFDPATRQGFIAVHQLPQQPANKRYHLWLVNTSTGERVDAGILPATPGGLFFFSVEFPQAPASDEIRFLVTAEDTSAPHPILPQDEAVHRENPI